MESYEGSFANAPPFAAFGSSYRLSHGCIEVITPPLRLYRDRHSR
ncbi:hypothetical protein [Pseudomonas caspiana]